MMIFEADSAHNAFGSRASPKPAGGGGIYSAADPLCMLGDRGMSI